MKKICLILSAVLMTAISVSSCGEGASSEKVSNEGVPKDEDSPLEVTIGKQVWMTENLNVDKFRNGDPIPEAKTNEEWEKAGKEGKPAWCYYDKDEKTGIVYGKLYNWYAVNDSRGLAPIGYHIPSDTEWTILSDYLGGEAAAGTKMKSTMGWTNEGNGTNSSGFSGLPCGYRYPYGDIFGFGSFGYWWSASEDSKNSAYIREMWDAVSNGPSDSLYRDSAIKGAGLSVRCLRD